MMAIFPLSFQLLVSAAGLSAPAVARAVVAEVVVNAGVDDVWKAWTTEEGIKTFLAPACRIDLRVLGAFDISFNPNAAPGQQTAEGNLILAIQPQKMFSFTWNAPPHLPNVSQQRTSVVVRFKPLGENQTKVTLTETGWGEDEEWDKAFAYFSSAWQEVVLPRLKYSLEVGPVDWKNPPYWKK
jgi:uncharacterized protein YndB with AHSA1/START domain